MLIANGLRKVDMQDLLVFLQVHQRQNLVEVAEHLSLSPSTVSYCLKKLRQAFDDELFIATRGGMQPTHKSRAMLPTWRKCSPASTPVTPPRAASTRVASRGPLPSARRNTSSC